MTIAQMRHELARACEREEEKLERARDAHAFLKRNVAQHIVYTNGVLRYYREALRALDAKAEAP